MDETVESAEAVPAMARSSEVTETYGNLQRQMHALQKSEGILSRSMSELRERMIRNENMLEAILGPFRDIGKAAATFPRIPPTQALAHEQEQIRKLEYLQSELEKKSQDIRQLDEIIQQSGNKRDEPLTDDQISRMFDHLSQSILRTVSGHFHTASSQTIVENESDFPLMMRCLIANVLAQNFFSPAVKLFGLCPLVEKAQREFEQHLLSSKIDEEEVAEWRTLVIKMGRKAVENGKKEHRQSVLNGCQELLGRLQKLCMIPSDVDDNPVQGVLKELCEEAWSLALRLRMSRSTYFWGQDIVYAQDLLSDEDVEHIQLDISSSTCPTEFHTLFGPLYKIINNEMILVRRGEVILPAQESLHGDDRYSPQYEEESESVFGLLE